MLPLLPLVVLIVLPLVDGQCTPDPFLATDTVPPSPTFPLVAPRYPLLKNLSQLVPVLKPGPLYIEPRTNCPHQATDLVHWHNPAIWGGSVPTKGDVTLPANKKVLVSSCSWPAGGYNKITVPASSELIINDAPMTLKFRNLLVNGAFRIGSPTCRVYSKIQIHFLGGKVTTDEIAPHLGAKGIGVTASGVIDIHGKQYHPTWSRLVHPATAGESVIFLDDAVNWEVNQYIVITTTSYYDLEELTTLRPNPLPPHQNEVKRIAAISGRKILLDSPLEFDHYAGTEYQAEVGLLTRRIQIFGNTNTAEMFGGHILVTGIGRFSGIELYQMGQLNMMARYPLHFHLGFSKPKNFVTDCSIHKSNFRCITIHSTNNTKVSRNVAYDGYGSCIYLEDGVEENNEISFNLVVHTKTIGIGASGNVQAGQQFDSKGEAIQPADHSAAGIYITNAWNKIYGNAVSGGWAGFSFPNMYSPTGLSGKNASYANFVPSSKTNLVFSHNSAHSAGQIWGSGACIYVGGKIWENATTGVINYNSGRASPRSPVLNGQRTWNYWENIRVFLCNKGLNHWGNRAIVKGLECYDTTRCGVLFGDSAIDNALFSGASGNVAQLRPSTDAFSFYDTAVRTVLTNIRCVNYNRPGAYCLRATVAFDVFKPEGIAATKGFTFINTPPANKMDPFVRDLGSSRFLNIYDADGSFSGKGTPQILGASTLTPTESSLWWNYKSTCELHDEIKMYFCPKSSSKEEIIHIYALSPGLINDNRGSGVIIANNSNAIGKVYLFGAGTTERWTKLTKNPGITGVSGVGGWYWDFDAEPSQLYFRTVNLAKGRILLVAVRYPVGTTFTILRYKGSLTNFVTYTAAASLAEVMSSDGTKYYVDRTTGHLFIKLVSIVAGSYFSYNGAALYDQFGGRSDISITAVCPKSSCSAAKLIPSLPLSAVISSEIPNEPTRDTNITYPTASQKKKSEYVDYISPTYKFSPVRTQGSWFKWNTLFDKTFTSTDTITSPLSSTSPSLITCGSESYVFQGGFNKNLTYTTSNTPKSFYLRITFRVGFLDSFDGGEMVRLFLNNEKIWESSKPSSTQQYCGSVGSSSAPWYFDVFETYTIDIPFSKSSFTLVWSANLNTGFSDESFAIKSIKIETLTLTGNPVDCVWSAWTAYSPVPCTSGDQSRTRSITRNASPSGMPCAGRSLWKRPCTASTLVASAESVNADPKTTATADIPTWPTALIIISVNVVLILFAAFIVYQITHFKQVSELP